MHFKLSRTAGAEARHGSSGKVTSVAGANNRPGVWSTGSGTWGGCAAGVGSILGLGTWRGGISLRLSISSPRFVQLETTEAVSCLVLFAVSLL